MGSENAKEEVFHFKKPESVFKSRPDKDNCKPNSQTQMQKSYYIKNLEIH